MAIARVIAMHDRCTISIDIYIYIEAIDDHRSHGLISSDRLLPTTVEKTKNEPLLLRRRINLGFVVILVGTFRKLKKR